MVSMGKFQKLCLRFAEDFNHTLDDWKPDPTDPTIMNLCLVSEVNLALLTTLLFLFFAVLVRLWVIRSLGIELDCEWPIRRGYRDLFIFTYFTTTFLVTYSAA
jgi:hypothetical protein